MVNKMFFTMINSAAAISILGFVRVAIAADVHGSSAQGTMGPVAFLWPTDRTWSADTDNVGPCGSNVGVTNRTVFPFGSIGSIELTIAGDAYDMAVRIAYGNNPITQEDFHPVFGNISQLKPGHQCYSVSNLPNILTTGSNATLQLEYWANDSNKNESFFTCADITFVEKSLFTEQVPCFNVTSSDFELPSSSSTPSGTASTATSIAANPSTGSNSTAENHINSGLSAGVKAGIAVAAVIGTALIAGAAFLFFRRKRQTRKDLETVPEDKSHLKRETASIGSTETAN